MKPAASLPASVLGAGIIFVAAHVAIADVRDQTRIVRRGTSTVTPAQASDLTLTLSDVQIRQVQTWVRTAGKLDSTGKTISPRVRGTDAKLIEVGQRVRAFSVGSRTQMHQGKVTRVIPVTGGAQIEVTLADHGQEIGSFYLAEILVERGRFRCVPNASLLEEENHRFLYVQVAPGQFERREVHTGIQGELYTEISDGVSEGEQVVSVGSFFVDADVKLKSGEAGEP